MASANAEVSSTIPSHCFSQLLPADRRSNSTLKAPYHIMAPKLPAPTPHPPPYRSPSPSNMAEVSARPPCATTSSSSPFARAMPMSFSHDINNRSTVPGSDDLSPSPAINRHWKPTQPVPIDVSRRYRVTNSDHERKKCLSEDEGTGEGVTAEIDRQRRPSASHMLSREQQAGPVPTMQVRLEDKTGLRQNCAPIPQQHSHSPPPSKLSESVGVSGSSEHPVGSRPLHIQDIAADHSEKADSLLLSTTSSTTSFPISNPTLVPDPANGRAGGVIRGVGRPGHASENIDEATRDSREQAQLLDKLSRILVCAICPTRKGIKPGLHHPITLPCGHTLSAGHINIPVLPPLNLGSDLSPHGISAAHQAQQHQRLSLWAGVKCPIPTCKRYSPSASSTPVIEVPEYSTGSPQSRPGWYKESEEETVSSVPLYPRRRSAVASPTSPPAYSATAPNTVFNDGVTPLLDVTVDKVIDLVAAERRRLRANEPATVRSTIDTNGSDTDESQDESPIDYIGQGRTSPIAKQLPKRRRRNTLWTPSSGFVDHSPGEWKFNKEMLAICECDVCALLMHEPVTTPCQHTFCSKCLARSLDHSPKCPVCRQELPSSSFFQDHAINRVILSIIKTALAEEYEDRCRSIEREERDTRLDTPIFVCTLAFPGMPTILHVFEPRYRLMIRRCIESSSPRFGMVLPARGTDSGPIEGVMEYGTMLEIQSVQMLPDGRSMVETVGIHRFKLLEKGGLDGYTVGRVERIDDVSQDEDAQLQEAELRDIALRGGASARARSAVDPTHLQESHSPLPHEDEVLSIEEYMDICRLFIDQLRSGSAPWLLQRLNNTYGSMPSDPSEFSYWMALVMPIDEYEKARLLPIRSPRLRLKLIVHWVESLRSSWWFSSGASSRLAANRCAVS